MSYKKQKSSVDPVIIVMLGVILVAIAFAMIAIPPVGQKNQLHVPK